MKDITHKYVEVGDKVVVSMSKDKNNLGIGKITGIRDDHVVIKIFWPESHTITRSFRQIYKIRKHDVNK